MVAQLKKGVLEFCILHIIAADECYGYEIMKKITAVFSDTGEQTVYTILRRLLADDYTACFSKEISNGPPRKYYRITKKGSEYLAQCKEDWQSIQVGVAKILQNAPLN